MGIFRWLSRFEYIIALFESVGVSAFLSLLALIVFGFIWRGTRREDWKDYASGSYRLVARWGGGLLLFLVACGLGNVSDEYYERWKETPIGFISSECRPSQSNRNCRTIQIPNQLGEQISMPGVRLVPHLDNTGNDERIALIIDVDRPRTGVGVVVKRSRLDFPAKAGCFSFIQVPGVVVVAVVVDDSRSLTQVGVVTAPGGRGFTIGPTSCEDEVFRNALNEKFPL